ncbi:Vhc1 protein [Starmerella bacillaris]|uniref:Vhc1 protein n=1 Tax=Starmerella bacillaris TaxID=1247836 RepID=A0AAV5RLL7_STABA|nr:Vhc1 protein [Starmerella bacillaris]
MTSVINNTKLNTFEGVFIPTTLNVLSILIYLRFGFIVGQAGILGSLSLLAIAYCINLLTTLSVSAIATNGNVKGGGAYYMISRSLGPEFGGSIGLVFYLGQVLNAGLNVAGFSDPLLANFGINRGKIAQILPDSGSWPFVYQSILLVMCTLICFSGPGLFARSSKLLFYVLLIATVAIPASVFIVDPFFFNEFDAWYTGPSLSTVYENMWPEFTKGAAGSVLDERENFRDLFGICFSATAGILAGASMSGDLERPSKSIPKGTLNGLLLTFVLYSLVILSLGSSASRKLLWSDVEVIRDVSLSSAVVMLGEFSTCIFSALMGIFGAATLLQAISTDKIIPFVNIFSDCSGDQNVPKKAILFTFILTQLTLFLPVNQIAGYVTMTFLMTFAVLNFACFCLKIASAPNFRPSFRYFNNKTAFLGFLLCIAAMFVADIYAALTILIIELIAFVVIHSYAPAKPWGDVSQSIIYHQVRKYLLIMNQNHVKNWRPQILLLVDDPRSCWKLIGFCNFLKKGGLFILGHVVVVNREEDFRDNFPEISKQRAAWEKIKELHHIKAFFQICASPSINWGVRNVFLGSGLGGMRPNITVIGFYDEKESGQHREFVDIDRLPTDACRKERHLSSNQWVQIIEDLITMGSNVCVAKGFMDAELPPQSSRFVWPWSLTPSDIESLSLDENSRYVDLYPIQMSAHLMDSRGNLNGISINLDTYTLILQLGSVLQSVHAWKSTHVLRVIAFVELKSEVAREKSRIEELLESLRIHATVVVTCLEENNKVYDVIVKGEEDTDGFVESSLKSWEWWTQLKGMRQNPHRHDHRRFNDNMSSRTYVLPQIIGKRKRAFSFLQSMGVSHSMQTTRWMESELSHVTDYDSGDESSEDSSNSPSNNTTSDIMPSNGDEISGDSSDSIRHNSSVLHRDNGGPDVAPNFRDDLVNVSISSISDLVDNAQPFDSSPDSSLYHNSNDDSHRSYPNYMSGSSHANFDSIPEINSDALNFNCLPAKAQHLVINCVMREISSKSTVIFTTLPAPALNTHCNDASSQDYYESLKILSADLPPMAMIHAQSMTVTTDL